MFGAALFAVGDATWESFPPGIIQVFYKEDDDKLKGSVSKLQTLAIHGLCDSIRSWCDFSQLLSCKTRDSSCPELSHADCARNIALSVCSL